MIYEWFLDEWTGVPWGDPGPCPVDDAPHTSCVSADYALQEQAQRLVVPLGSQSQRVVVPVPRSGSGTARGPLEPEAGQARAGAGAAPSSGFSTKTYRRATHGRRLHVHQPMSTAFVVAPWTQPSTIYQKLITPPAAEPLTVEEAKLLAAMTWPVTNPPDLRDAMVQDFIRAARERVERDTGLALISQVRELHVLVPLNVIPLPSQCLPATEILDITPVINPLAHAPPPDSGVELDRHLLRADPVDRARIPTRRAPSSR